MKSDGYRIVICGGGTGGHVFPAIAIANAIRTIAPNTKILFVGAKGKMEMEKVPAAGYEIKGLDVVGFRRSLSLSNLAFPFKLWKSIRQAREIVDAFQPDAGVGVGGYASGPILRILGNRGIPYLIQEQNSFAGITNRVLAKKAAVICTAYDGMQRFFPEHKIVQTGNPVRDAIVQSKISRAEAVAHFGLTPDKKTVLVIGGSLGAAAINQALLEHANDFIAQDVQLIWQTGKGYIDHIKNALPEHPLRNVSAFIERMDMAYAAADIIISRAGALSISELCIAGKACILLPSPNVSEDHQTHNAMSLVNKQAAWMIRDSEAKQELVKTALQLLHDSKRCEILAANIRPLGVRDAAERIAAEVLKLPIA